ncbi:MAG: flavin reductase family protein [Rickettsiaceae bacterium]|nr:flavin reductase family protein [Rickettsiaceae bacterium]
MHIDDFKHAVGKFPTGICIITTQYQNQPFGFTANSFVSVSLVPPLISFCLNKKALSLDAFEHSEYFIINILSEDQSDIASKFARSGIEKFVGMDYHVNNHQIPIIPNNISFLECKHYKNFDCGDHIIFIGLVEKVTIDSNKKPLLYYGRQYKGLL